MTIGDSSVTFQIMKIMWKKYLTIFKYLNQKVSDLYWLLGDLWPQTPHLRVHECVFLNISSKSYKKKFFPQWMQK